MHYDVKPLLAWSFMLILKQNPDSLLVGVKIQGKKVFKVMLDQMEKSREHNL